MTGRRLYAWIHAIYVVNSAYSAFGNVSQCNNYMNKHMWKSLMTRLLSSPGGAANVICMHMVFHVLHKIYNENLMAILINMQIHTISWKNYHVCTYGCIT